VLFGGGPDPCGPPQPEFCLCGLARGVRTTWILAGKKGRPEPVKRSSPSATLHFSIGKEPRCSFQFRTSGNDPGTVSVASLEVGNQGVHSPESQLFQSAKNSRNSL